MKAAKTFFLVCAGILMLAMAANLFTQDAVASSEGERGLIVDVFYESYNWWAVTDVGDIYGRVTSLL